MRPETAHFRGPLFSSAPPGERKCFPERKQSCSSTTAAIGLGTARSKNTSHVKGKNRTPNLGSMARKLSQRNSAAPSGSGDR